MQPLQPFTLHTRYPGSHTDAVRTEESGKTIIRTYEFSPTRYNKQVYDTYQQTVTGVSVDEMLGCVVC